jgi:hypothetical protein
MKTILFWMYNYLLKQGVEEAILFWNLELIPD